MKNLITFENWNLNSNNQNGKISEKWDSKVKVEKTGEHADKTIAELKKELQSLKEWSKVYQEEGKKVPKRIIEQEAEIKFAIRAKQGWKKKIV
jgi:hypothetical protein